MLVLEWKSVAICSVTRSGFVRRVKECCYLLTLKLGDALLLKGTLFEALHTVQSSGVQDPVATVQEQGVFKLSAEEAELVLSRRNDLLRS